MIRTLTRRRTSRCAALLLLAAVGLSSCDDGTSPDPGGELVLAAADGDEQTAQAGTTLPEPLVAELTLDGEPVAGAPVEWSVTVGGGTVEPTALVTDNQGRAFASFTLGPGAGEQTVRARSGDASVTFSATATAEPPPPTAMRVAAGGNNVPERFTSDLWLHGQYAYTGTWGSFPRNGTAGNALKIWALGASGAPSLANTLIVPNISTVSDVEVSADGTLLLFGAEGQTGAGLYVYGLADPANPVFLDSVLIPQGIHTATFGYIGGKTYAFAAKNPSNPALLVYEVTPAGELQPAATVPVPADYGIHDTFVRDGLAFVFAWNTGVIILDVGDGRQGGSPSDPQEIGRIVTSANGVAGGAQVHNGWWYHAPGGERRYLFVGQEGPGTIGSASSGDIHVVDVSDPANPQEVAFYHMAGAGTHNFWMDEARGVLYAAYYNGGVVALDVTGTLSGDLASREIARIRPGGSGNTYVWGVQLHQGSLYASDMLSGLWQLELSAPLAAR